jgi:DNA mismatch endonuclease (patch repair protein)
MVDSLTRAERSRVMGLVRSKDSKPEMFARRLTHGLGYRYRLHDKRLPGCPDMVFRRRRKVIFVHGCFWHRHRNCALARSPWDTLHPGRKWALGEGNKINPKSVEKITTDVIAHLAKYAKDLRRVSLAAFGISRAAVAALEK